MVAQLVKALHYKTECRGLDSDGVIGIFVSLISSGRTTILESAQPPIEMITRGISCGVKAVGT
jgi:hypothetical protein